MPDLQEWLPKHHRTESPFACCLPSCFSHGQLFVTLWTVAHQALLSIGFSRQEYWIGLLCPPPRNLLNPRIEPTSLTSPAFAGGLSRSNQSILKEISPGCSLEGMMLNWSSSTLDTSSEELTHWKNSDAGREWEQKEKGTTENEMAGWASPTQWTWVWVNSRSWWWTGRLGVLRFTGLQRVRHDWAIELN